MSDLCLLAALFPTTETQDLAVMFGRTYQAIACMASLRGLKKTKAFYRQKARINIRKAQEWHKQNRYAN
jgi:hypothetical protein